MEDDMRQMTSEELAALCTNLEKACTKQLRAEEAGLFAQLAAYYDQHRLSGDNEDYKTLLDAVDKDLASGYETANKAASEFVDRGAKRALVWGEKVSKLLKSLLMRYEKQQNSLLEGTSVWVCAICGFIYVGDTPPTICPICKVPSFKIQSIAKEAL